MSSHELHLEYSPDLTDEEIVLKARRTLSQIAARHGLSADDLEEVMAMLGVIKDVDPTRWRYTPEGRRVRPCNQSKATRQRLAQQAAEGGVDGGRPPDPPDAA